MRPVDVFHIGPQKAATTWVYHCLNEHPEVACPPNDSIHYFDIFYHRGRSWYEDFFSEAREGQKLFDPTPSYIRSPWAPRRIAKENASAKIILCMRHPIKRAFSHYWHEKKKNKINFDFSEVLENYDLFASWIEPGFYAEHIQRYLDYFEREQIFCQHFDDLEANPEDFLQQILTFIGVDPEFKSTFLHRKVNVAGPSTITGKLIGKLKSTLDYRGIRIGFINSLYESSLSAIVSGKLEYKRGVAKEVYEMLWEICEPEVERLEHLLDIELTSWRQNT